MNRDIQKKLRIKRMLDNEISYNIIAKNFNVSKQRIQQVAEEFGVSYWENSRNKKKNLVTRINEFMEKNPNACYNTVIKKFNLSPSLLAELRRCVHNLRFSRNNILKRRNKRILSLYKNDKLTANQIIKKGICGLNSCNQVYNVTGREFNFYKARTKKNLNDRLFEKRHILKLIFKLRYKDKLSYRKIAEYLNKNKHKTINGKAFTEGNIPYKCQVAWLLK